MLLRNKKCKYKSPLENHIFHGIAKSFPYKPKSYSTRYIQLQKYKLNGINILNLYLNSSDNNDFFTIKKEQLSF